jgi:hypothetical protein
MMIVIPPGDGSLLGQKAVFVCQHEAILMCRKITYDQVPGPVA